MFIKSATYKILERNDIEVEIVLQNASGNLDSYIFSYHSNPMGLSKLFYDKKMIATFRNYRDVPRVIGKAIEHLETKVLRGK